MSDSKPSVSTDTYQDGVAPVQAFTSRGIPAADAEAKVRQGRPPRARTEQSDEGEKVEIATSTDGAVMGTEASRRQ